jgi:hypothetical protein
MIRNDDDLSRGLEPMFRFMSKHGMPEHFPADGAHFSEMSLVAKCEFR